MPAFKEARSGKTDVYDALHWHARSKWRLLFRFLFFFFPPGSPEQMLQRSVPGWGTAGSCCKSLQHQQLREPQPHGRARPALLRGFFKKTVVTARRARGRHEQRDGTTAAAVGGGGGGVTGRCDCLKRSRVQTALVSEPRCQVPPSLLRSLVLQGCEIRLTT